MGYIVARGSFRLSRDFEGGKKTFIWKLLNLGLLEGNLGQGGDSARQGPDARAARGLIGLARSR